jgi:sugar (pentulose or hexulose) kinase
MTHTIDVGSTSIKYACFSEIGVCLNRKSIPFPLPVFSDLYHYEVDIRQILSILTAALKNAIASDNILLSVQMHGYLLLDKIGKPLTNYISWQDTRSLLLPESIRYSFDLPVQSGVGKKPNLPLAGLWCMKNLQPKIFESARMFCTLGSYIALCLTGNNASHITDCAATGLYNSRTGKRREISFLNDMLFPKAQMEFRSIGLWRGVSVFSPVGDHQCSIKGSNCSEEEILLNIGTAAQVCTIERGFSTGNYESRPYFGDLTLCTVTGLIGGKDYSTLCSNEDYAVEKLFSNYSQAIDQLPRKKRIRALGGACKYYRNVIEKVLNKTELEWSFSQDGDAMQGLYSLLAEAEEI